MLNRLAVLLCAAWMLGASFPSPGPGRAAYETPAAGTLGVVEQRCSDLGSNCICSETLDATFSLPVSTEETANLPPSTGSTECELFEMEPTADPGDFLGAPPNVALTGATNVMEVLPGPYGWLTSRAPTSGMKRMCVRYYFIVTDDYSGQGNLSCPTQRNKLAQMTFDTTTPQIQERSDTDACSGPGYGAYREFWLDTQTSGTILSPSIRFSDCNESTGWCGVELCIGSSSDLDTTATKSIEAYMWQVDSGSESSATVSESHGPATGAYFGADLYHGGGTGAAGSRFISAFMAAEWSTNAGQRIGTACEIEGC